MKNGVFENHTKNANTKRLFSKLTKSMNVQSPVYKTYKTANIAPKNRFPSSLPMRLGEGGLGCFVSNNNVVERYQQ